MFSSLILPLHFPDTIIHIQNTISPSIGLNTTIIPLDLSNDSSFLVYFENTIDMNAHRPKRNINDPSYSTAICFIMNHHPLEHIYCHFFSIILFWSFIIKTSFLLYLLRHNQRICWKLLDQKMDWIDEWRTTYVCQDLYFPVVSMPGGKHPTRCSWLYKIKHNAYKTVDGYRPHLVAKEYRQLQCVDYIDTFSHVAKLVTVKLILDFAAKHGWPLTQMD